MVSGTIKADAREALEALNANISQVFALYLAGRQGRRAKGAKAICNKFLKFKGRELTLGTASVSRTPTQSSRSRTP